MLWVMRLREGSVPAPAEPLSEAVWEWASAGLRRMAAPVASLGLVSVACGIAASALLWRIAGEVGENAVERLVGFVLLATMGTSQLFFGYVESYPVAVVALLAYLAVGLRAARDRRAPVLLVVLYAVAVASHLMALYLAPSFLYLVLRGERSVPGRVWRLGGALLLSILLLLALGSRPVNWIHTFDVATRAARTGAAALDATRPYGILSLDHLVDIVNELWLVLPIPLLLLVSAIVAGKGARGDPRETFLILAAGAGLLGLLLLVLPVAAAQDWDLMAMLLLPLGVLGVAWGRSLYASRTAARIACVSAALGSLLAFVLVNASQASATRRFETIVGPGAKISSFGRWYAWESLAQHYRHLGRYDEAMRYVDGLLRTAPSNPRYWGMAGETLNGFGRYAEAVPFLQESLRRNPNRPTARTNLGIA
jgi:hypothetical protein